MVTKLSRMLTFFDWVLPIKSEGPLSCGFSISRDKLKQLYLYYYRAYGHQTCRLVTYFEGLLPYRRKTLNEVVWLNHVTN